MKILLITDEVWNDKIHGNNILTNWFEGFDAEFANIYCSPGYPQNNCCKKYFQITDKMMFRSLISRQKAGKSFYLDNTNDSNNESLAELENRKLYEMLKSISTEILRAVREMIWNYGRYDIDALKEFIDEFNPDIIFAPRMATIKILRLEKIVYKIANVPIVAFTGDAEYSMRLFRLSPVFWIKKLILRKKFREMMPDYSLYYTLSDEQKLEYEKEFGNKFKILRKVGNFSHKLLHNNSSNPIIKIVYAGKLYSNRWRTLVEIIKVIRNINKNERKIILEIYSKDKLTQKQYKLLNDNYNSFFMGGVAADTLTDIYNQSDIALHVESFDLKNKLLTRVSFSTKIIDCLASGCAVMVVSWKEHSGYKYLKREDAAFTIGSINEITSMLNTIVSSPEIVNEYRTKAVRCGINNHDRIKIQKEIYNDFESIIASFDSEKGRLNNENNTNQCSL